MYQHIQQGLNNCISENCANYRKRRLAPVSTHRPGRADQRLWTETSQRSHCRLWSPSVRSFWYCCLVAKSCLFAKSCSFDTPWTVARQAPLSVGFPRQEYWSGLPFPSPRDLPHLGIEPAFFTLGYLGSPLPQFSSISFMITEEVFLISPAILWNILTQMGISFLFSFAFHFSSFDSYL